MSTLQWYSINCTTNLGDFDGYFSVDTTTNIIQHFSKYSNFGVNILATTNTNGADNMFVNNNFSSSGTTITTVNDNWDSIYSRWSFVYDDNFIMMPFHMTNTNINAFDIYADSWNTDAEILNSITFSQLQNEPTQIIPPPLTNPVNFVVTAFESQIQLTNSVLLPTTTNELVADAHIVLDATVLATDLQNAFFYKTDLLIIGSDSFVYHYVDTTKWQNIASTMNPQNGRVEDGFVSNDPIGKDFLRYLAKKLFGTYLAADLFINEDAVVAEIRTKCGDMATNIENLLNNIDLNQGIHPGLLQDSNQKLYMHDDRITSENISRELFNQLTARSPTRFSDLTLYKYNGTEDGFYKLPILAGDTISFKLTISPSTTQLNDVRTTSLTIIPDRTYGIKLRIV